jgi:hypothetical protein
MNTAPTPETDREDIIITKGKPTHWVSQEFARRLKRERDEARDQRDRLAVALGEIARDEDIPMSLRSCSPAYRAKQALQSLTRVPL